MLVHKRLRHHLFIFSLERGAHSPHRRGYNDITFDFRTYVLCWTLYTLGSRSRPATAADVVKAIRECDSMTVARFLVGDRLQQCIVECFVQELDCEAVPRYPVSRHVRQTNSFLSRQSISGLNLTCFGRRSQGSPLHSTDCRAIRSPTGRVNLVLLTHWLDWPDEGGRGGVRSVQG